MSDDRLIRPVREEYVTTQGIFVVASKHRPLSIAALKLRDLLLAHRLPAAEPEDGAGYSVPRPRSRRRNAA